MQFLLGVLAWLAANTGNFIGLSPVVQNVLAAAGVILGLLGIHGVTGAPSPFVTWLDSLPGSGYKTIIGTMGAVLGYLLSPSVFAVIPASFGHILIVIGTTLAGFGLYHAVSKARRGVK